MYDGIEYRGFGQDNVEQLARYAGVPVWNGLTDEWHPTQMLADLLTMREHCGKPVDEIAFCLPRRRAQQRRATRCWWPGAMMGMDVRMAGPAALWPAATRWSRRCAERSPRASGARITDHRGRRPRACAGATSSTPTSGCPWASPTAGLGRAHRAAARPTRSTRRLLGAAGNPAVKFMHCLPAFHDRDTEVGAEIFEQYRPGRRWRSPTRSSSRRARSSSTRRRTGCTPSRRSWSPLWAG